MTELIDSSDDILEGAYMETPEFKFSLGDKLPLPEVHADPLALQERQIDENDRLPIYFLASGLAVQGAVARVVLRKAHRGLPPGRGWATGFMVSPSLFLTNNHVIPEQAFNDSIRIQFNYQQDAQGMDEATESYLPAADVFRTNPALDYTLIRLQPFEDVAGEDEPTLAGSRWGFIPLNESPLYRKKQHFNIIQHPKGEPKQVALQDNEIDELFDAFVRYKGDTEPGSSGSPVFNNLWELVALHHAGGAQDASGKWLNNQGVRIDAIIKDLRDSFADRQEILDELGIS
ncbi:MAG: trypsin-like serine peptidase [Candidatus Promineifilaceae bacterium]|jgi:endonuclease G